MALDLLLHLQGGPVIDFNDYEEPRSETKCVAGNIDCQICDEEGNFDYKEEKWYEFLK